jgi:hypothetical protein
MTVALTVNATGTQQLKHHHSHSAEASSVPQELQGGVCSECALVLQQDCLDAPQSSRTGSGRYACTQPLDDLARLP